MVPSFFLSSRTTAQVNSTLAIQQLFSMGNHLKLIIIMHFHKTVFGKQQMQENAGNQTLSRAVANNDIRSLTWKYCSLLPLYTALVQCFRTRLNIDRKQPKLRDRNVSLTMEGDFRESHNSGDLNLMFNFIPKLALSLCVSLSLSSVVRL